MFSRLSKHYRMAMAVLLIVLCCCAYYALWTPASQYDKTTSLTIKQGDTMEAVMQQATHYLNPIHSLTLRILCSVTGYGERMHSGRYDISPQMGVLTLFRKLRNGSQDAVKLTLKPVRTIPQLAGQLSARLALDSLTLVTHLQDSAYTAQWGYTPATIISLFIPNTYHIYWDITMTHFMQRMVQEHAAFWDKTRLAQAAAAQLTPTQVYTLASIIDEETANNAEKPIIAGMYINRLRQLMPLQADPTIKFALQDFALKRIYKKLLATASPYNTYVHTGLPPGPIRIASIAGIDAVLHYQQHDYLYMCAKEDFSGTHNFAKTYVEHLKNAARYTLALNLRGIQ